MKDISTFVYQAMYYYRSQAISIYFETIRIVIGLRISNDFLRQTVSCEVTGNVDYTTQHQTGQGADKLIN